MMVIKSPKYSLAEATLFHTARSLQKPFLRLLVFPGGPPHVTRRDIEARLTSLYESIIPELKALESKFPDWKIRSRSCNDGCVEIDKLVDKINSSYSRDLLLVNNQISHLAEWCASVILYRDGYERLFLPQWMQVVINRSYFN